MRWRPRGVRDSIPKPDSSTLLVPVSCFERWKLKLKSSRRILQFLRVKSDPQEQDHFHKFVFYICNYFCFVEEGKVCRGTSFEIGTDMYSLLHVE